MTDWNEFLVRHAGTHTEFAVNEARLVAGADREHSDLYNVLSTFEDDLARTERNLDRVQQDFDELARRHREEHAVVQKFIDFVKERLAEGDSVVIESWADFDEVFEHFDGFDLERPRRDWTATVTIKAEVTLRGSAWATWDEDDIAESITESYSHDVDVRLRVDMDEVSGDDSYVEDWDIANVDVTFND